jgi:hypothetical protein
MTRPNLFERIRYISISVGVLILAALNIGPARAQGGAMPPRAAAQLEQLLAPIALYPDSLLSQILMASTYPLEVVVASALATGQPDGARRGTADRDARRFVGSEREGAHRYSSDVADDER